MFKFKKLFCLLLICVMVFAVAGCSAVDHDYGVTSEGTTEKYKSNYDENAKIMSSDRVMPKYFDISLFDEENYADIYLGKKFEIDAEVAGQNFVVPCRIVDMQALGWELAKGNEYNENSLVFAYETIDVTFKNDKNVTIKAQMYNSSRSSVKLSECYVVKFKIENNFYKNSRKYTKFNINGITNTVAITDVINTLGTPSHFYNVSDTCYYLDYFITKKDRRNGITVYINPTDDIVTAVEFSYYK